MKFRFQSFFDIHTSSDSMQVIQWSVGGADVVNRCRHLFGAYKYFKLGRISVKLVPASTLPVDPLGLSYGETDPQTVDPRDQMNPGLVRITNGEDLYLDVSSLTADAQMQVYNSMMLDPRWSKFMLQSGFRRSAYPLYWQIGQLSQDKYPGATVNLRSEMSNVPIMSEHHYVKSNGYGDFRASDGSSARGIFQTGHRGKLGWLPTDYYQFVPQSGESKFTEEYGINNVPEVSVITCVLPKAYKTEYYYRCYITEEVLFSGLRSAPFDSPDDDFNGYLYGIDNFLMSKPEPYIPPIVRTAIVTDAQMNNGSEMP